MEQERAVFATPILPGQQDVLLTGSRVSPGLAMGHAHLVCDALDARDRSRRITSDEISREVLRIRTAFDQTGEELEKSARRIEEQFSGELADILRAHEKMLQSLLSSREFEDELRGSLVSAETAVRRVFRRWQEKFETLDGETFRQRADDIADIGRNIIRHLEGAEVRRFGSFPPDTVLVMERLLPSDVVSLSRRKVAGIIVESLGQASHAALLAREKGIPTVAGLPDLFDRIRDQDEILMDADRGEILVSPSPRSRTEFQQRFEKQRDLLDTCKGACRCPALTLDGTLVKVEANIGVYEDLELVFENGADGVGLFRIEQLYLARKDPPSEEELIESVRAITAPLRDKPVTIRLLDIGGDKPVPFLPRRPEMNPLLGQRGVRLLLEYGQLLRVQLAALLRLAQEQEIRVLVPMITLEDDVVALRTLFESMCVELNVATRPAFGAMIETPAAALNIPALARHVDFLCIGTNDLTQYTLAVARDDPAVNRYFLDNHASILRLIGMVVADAGDTPVSVCGELAARQEMIPQLLALGVRSLSMAPPLIPRVKLCIRSLRLASTSS